MMRRLRLRRTGEDKTDLGLHFKRGYITVALTIGLRHMHRVAHFRFPVCRIEIRFRTSSLSRVSPDNTPLYQPGVFYSTLAAHFLSEETLFHEHL